MRAVRRFVFLTFYLTNSWLLACWPLWGLAQTPSADSVITLRPVTVYGVPEARFAAGSKRETPDSLLRAHGQAGTLAGLLMQASPVYVREYGAGMLASVSFRGTAASHTALLWNGVNLNLLTLGQTDFNLVPLGAAQQVELHYGGASALYGSDALGGSIHLYSQPSWRPGVTGKFQQTVGSFGQFYTQAQAQVGRGRSEFRLNAYHQTTRNDFPFRNVARPGAPLERQTNAALRNYGLQPEFYYRFSPGRYLSVKGWYTYADRQIQPTMAATDVTDQQQDEGQRLVADYHDRSALGQFNLKLAYLQDWLRYNLGPRSLTRRYLGALSYEKRLGRQWQVQAGGNWQHIAAQVANYGHPLSENQAEAYALLRYEPNTRLVLTANFRQNWVSGQATTPAPALGAEWQLWQTGPAEQPRHQLRWKTALSRNYRVPTLNDRYWQPGGNPALRPELGYNAETGLAYHYQAGRWAAQAEATHYRLWVTDWIIWLPQAGFWAPENLRRVHGQGVEISARLSYQTKKWRLSGGGNYAYTRSTNQNRLNENDRAQGKQLPYVPLHRATLYAQWHYGPWHAQANWQVTSGRFTTTDNDELLPSFALWHLGAGREWALGRLRAHVGLRVNNALNAEYQNLRLRAMPGRSYQANLVLTW